MTMTKTATDQDISDKLRSVMAEVCTPVSVVTSLGPGGPRGSTVSAFTSLSMKPPMILIALQRTSDTLTAIRASGRFDLNVLASDQHGIAGHFAGKRPDKFADIGWTETATGARLRGAASWVSCVVRSMTDGGDHVIVVGLVRDAQNCESEPLTYHRRAFGTHSPLPVT